MNVERDFSCEALIFSGDHTPSEGDPRTGRAIGQREGSMSVASPLASRRFLASAPSANL